MSRHAVSFAIVYLLLLPMTLLGQAKVRILETGVSEINGKQVFGISVAVVPPPEGKTPDGKSAWQEFADAGVNLARIVPAQDGQSYGWTDKGYAVAREYLDALASARLHGWLWLGDDIAHFTAKDTAKAQKLRKLIETFKDHPALAFWKGEDEPLWGQMNAKEPGMKTPDTLELPYKMLRELDPHHPVIVIQAPRGTVKELAGYVPVLDITGVDVFPISYPPGGHLAKWPNHEISAVGDWTKILVEAAGGKPVWVTLQISFSGTATPGRTLRMPTFPEERFMTYQAIINGARAVNYFGGGNRLSLNDRDRELGWNWTFWQRVLRPLLEEINDKSPLAGALVAPDSKIPLKVKGGEGIETLVRETDAGVYVLACSREPVKTQKVEFTGLPNELGEAAVLYESPRKVTAKDGGFSDWFAPYDVHVYHFPRSK
jgi:hypothetical protein